MAHHLIKVLILKFITSQREKKALCKLVLKSSNRTASMLKKPALYLAVLFSN